MNMRFTRDISLERMCLNIIVENMDIFMSDHEKMKLQVLFLRRIYSDRLYELLYDRNLVDGDIIEWLLSPYWKSAHLVTANWSPDLVIHQMKVVGSGITSLTLENSIASVHVLSAILCSVPNVVFLNLNWTMCDDNTLAIIRKGCPKLSTLHINECIDVHDRGIMNLCKDKGRIAGYSSLRNISIPYKSVSARGVSFLLEHVPSLESVMHPHLHKVIQQFSQPGYFEPFRYDLRFNLQVFTYHYLGAYVTLKQGLLLWTLHCPKVEKVKINEAIGKQELDLLAEFKHLKNLHINVKCDTPAKTSLSSFVELSCANLTSLTLIHASISVEKVVCHCSQLQKIIFSNMFFEDFKTSAIGPNHKLDNLTELSVRHVNAEEESDFRSIKLLLSVSNNLQELSLQFVRNFKSDLVDIILPAQHLTSVDFSFTDITPELLKLFFMTNSIVKIAIDGCPYIITEGSHDIFKLINENDYGNTCSWQIEYSEIDKDSLCIHAGFSQMLLNRLGQY